MASNYLESEDFSEEETVFNIFLSQFLAKKTEAPFIVQLYAFLYFEREEHPRLKGYVDIVESKNSLDFFKIFRLAPETYYFLLNELFNDTTLESTSTSGSPSIDAKIQLLLTLKYLASKSTFQDLSELFGLSLSVVHRYVNKTINKIVDLGSKFIKWPTVDEARTVIQGFQNIYGFPGVIGAVDGCHIDCKVPADKQRAYLTRHNRHTTVLMAVCNSEKVFTYIYTGCAGSAHDSRIFKKSPLGKDLMQNSLSLVYNDDYHLIGDSAFAASNYMITPYKSDSLNTVQKRFNLSHSKTRVVIENCFGWLKNRFQRLFFIDADPEIIPSIISAACILHNICLLRSDYYTPNITTCTNDDDDDNDDEDNSVEKRDRIANSLYQ